MGVILGLSVHQIWTQVVIYATIPGQMWQNFPCAKHTATKFNPEKLFSELSELAQKPHIHHKACPKLDAMEVYYKEGRKMLTSATRSF